MKKKTIISIAILSSIFLTGFLMLHSAGKSANNTPCKESMKDCCKKKEGGSIPENLIWETFSRQFFSFAGEAN